MAYIVPILFVSLLFYLVYRSIKKAAIGKREKLIDSYQFPESIKQKVREKYPHLTEREAKQVMDGLRDYFHICNIAGNRMVSMPSQVVDVAWHEFILFTKKYEHFCKVALGRFLHHTPAEAMKSPTDAQAGIKTAWKIACYRESINAKTPHKLPKLFAIDKKLKIPDGFKYSLNCSKPGSEAYCAGHIGCGSGCGGGCSSDSSGCGGGCGGD